MNARAARASVLASPRPVPPRTTRTAARPLTVVPVPEARSGRAPFVLLILLVLSGGLAALLAFNTALAQGSFTASKLQQQATELDDRSQALEEQLARAAAPERLAKAARRIGMVPAPGVAFVGLADGKVTNGAVPAPAAPKPLTAAERAELEAEAEQAQIAKAAQAERKKRQQERAAAAAAAEQQRIAAEQAAAAEKAAREKAEREWQRKLAEQEKAGSRGGGEQVVDPPPGN